MDDSFVLHRPSSPRNIVMDVLRQILRDTLSPVQEDILKASSYLELAVENNITDLLMKLSDILRMEEEHPSVRMQAGIQLKNQIYSRDPDVNRFFSLRWLVFPSPVRTHIKDNVINSLGTETVRPSTAAQCVSVIGVIELEEGCWPDLIDRLIANAVGDSSSEMLKYSSLEAIGYICTGMQSGDTLQPQSNRILTALVHGMRNEPSNLVHISALVAMYNSLEFYRMNFENESERNIIMSVICDSTLRGDIPIYVKALQCLVKIVTLYYEHIYTYMENGVIRIVMDAMKSDCNEAVSSAVEFWSSIAEVEIDLDQDLDGGESSNKHIAKQSLSFVVPVLLHIMTNQNEECNDDDWNPSHCASVCLDLLSDCCKDDVLPYGLPFIKDHINDVNWRFREAAVMVLASILEGPSVVTMASIAAEAFPAIMNLLKDPSLHVRDSAMWLVGKFCDIFPAVVSSDPVLVSQLVSCLCDALEDHCKLAVNSCWTIQSLNNVLFQQCLENGSVPQTYPLSSCYEVIIEKLIMTAKRSERNSAGLRVSSFEAFMDLIKFSAKDCYHSIQKVTYVILEHLKQISKNMASSQSEAEIRRYAELKCNFCASLESVFRRLTPEDVKLIADEACGVLFEALSSSPTDMDLYEDVFLAMSAFIEITGNDFTKYVHSFLPFVIESMTNFRDDEICKSATGIISDIYLAVGPAMITHTDEIMQILLENLTSSSVQNETKPAIISAFGDIAIAIEHEFVKYTATVFETMLQVTNMQCNAPIGWIGKIGYLKDLKESCLVAFSQIIQGLRGDRMEPTNNVALSMVEPYVEGIAQFIVKMGDWVVGEPFLGSACGLLGDLLKAFGPNVIPSFEKHTLRWILERGCISDDPNIHNKAAWAKAEMGRYYNMNDSTLLG